MSSSSIEVMGGEMEEVDMMLMGDHSSSVPPSQLNEEEIMNSNEYEEAMATSLEENMEMEDFDDLAQSSGAILFSPQDTLENAAKIKIKRKKKTHFKRPQALTIKLEEGVDYSKINVPVACEICGKLMANGKILVQHMATHSTSKAFQCPHCPKSFTRLVHLQGHLVYHGIQKQFECPECHQRFSRQDCVRVHMRLHDKTKCVFCSVCHKAFLTIGALNIHMRIHRGEKPFKCHLCGKCFTQKNHVITHIKRHSKLSDEPFQKKLGPRMFVCEHCPRSFIRLSDYERHVQWNHGAVADSAMEGKLGNRTLKMDNEYNGRATYELMSDTQTLDSKVRKRPYFSNERTFSAPKAMRKTMCSIGTQTDGDGGKVIIPRKYQSSSEITHASAPATPRHDEDNYEIYDEGMDRNYSSDEDDILEEGSVRVSDPDIVPIESIHSNNLAKNEEFDAVVSKLKQDFAESTENESSESVEQVKQTEDGPSEELEKSKNDNSDISTGNYDLNIVPNEKTGEETSTVKTKVERIEESENPSLMPESPTKPQTPQFLRPPNKPSLFKVPTIPQPVKNFYPSDFEDNESNNDISEHDPMIREDAQKATTISKKRIQMRPPSVKILDTFNTKNWRGRGRGRGRRRSKGIIGLTGATHLRLIRKSMMNFITEKNEQMNETIKQDLADSAEIKIKRQSKVKIHGDDYVCNNKSCEMCCPNEEPQKISRRKGSNGVQEPTEQSGKLLQFLVSGDAKKLQGTDFRLLHESKPLTTKKLGEQSMLEEIDLGIDHNEHSSMQDELDTIKALGSRTEFFSASRHKDDDYASPHVELQAFCIPTYSCKLCGREFRFEGKLHRHIEAVHQKKEIFSPDVKPGRGSAKYNEREMNFVTELEMARNMNTFDEEMAEDGSQSPRAPNTPQNPEIEALRSEWDDDDAENDSSMPASEIKPIISNTCTVRSTPISSHHLQIINAAASTSAYSVSKKLPLDARNIAPVHTNLSDIYLKGVKVNINTLSGLAEFDQQPRRRTIDHNPQPAPMIRQEIKEDSLDTKCQKLLEKLFDHNLLSECGLYQDHVSSVLGKVLQHYGVKMIEDYGQGQYEVLKYNLWRLIEWKVTMEQMQDFYTEGKSVEEMMDDIMNGRVPIIASHHVIEPTEQPQEQQHEAVGETVQIGENQLVLSQVANVLSGQCQLDLGGVTQVVLAQDVSPELLQGAQIVTIDPTTGQVISQVTADQVILADSLGDSFGQQIQTLSAQEVVVSQSSLPPGSIVATSLAGSHIMTTESVDHVKL